MPLIQSISGMRGTIGGQAGQALTPLDVVTFTAAFAQWLCNQGHKKIAVIGRDARPSGAVIAQLVSATLQNMGVNVIDLGHTTTPTLAMVVTQMQASGGIVITASHNPGTWNGLKTLNAQGECVDAATALEIFANAKKGNFCFAEATHFGSYTRKINHIQQHIAQILKLPLVDVAAIRKRKFHIVVDAVNSTGGIAVPQLLQALGIERIIPLYCVPTGLFPHNPEPVPEHLTVLAQQVQQQNADLGIAVDPDVDRLAMIDENGHSFGEEYTLVAVADYVLDKTPGNTVSNLSSCSALKDITEKYNQRHTASPVGEVHVVAAMKATNAVVGGEGNGGVIYPDLHYGRDALVGIALFLSHLAQSKKTAAALKAGYPQYHIVKEKMNFPPAVDAKVVLQTLQKKYVHFPMNTQDGLKITLPNGWVHLRQSNTEPIVRVYAQADSKSKATDLAHTIMEQIRHMATKNA